MDPLLIFLCWMLIGLVALPWLMFRTPAHRRRVEKLESRVRELKLQREILELEARGEECNK